MHIEPGIVHGAKMVLAYGTAAAAGGYTLKLIADDLKTTLGASTLPMRAGLATIGTFLFFELLPHFPAGISEVHFILGTTLFLLLGAGAAAIGLTAGLLIQGMVFAPTDLPMFFVNVTTLLVPLFAMDALAKRVIPQNKAYVDLRYGDVLKLSATYQGGIVAWVVFWAFWGQGFGAETFASIGAFAAAYMVVVLIEPIADLAVLWVAKATRGGAGILTPRLYNAA